ncbi:RICIN domain-containing protein [Microlunatus ginsengisoli]|uniref:Ricin B lectin domain-containing protein n=1 Tax=Microlunatus ginsengisoli TaxID=363863 RepID=A0ABP6ZUS7_9ACTN
MNTHHQPGRAAHGVRRRLGVAAATVAALALLTTASGCSADAADPQDLIGSGARQGAGSAGSPACQPPPSPTELRSAQSVALGGDKETNPFIAFIGAVGEEAGTFGEDQGLGWLLNVITGGQKDQTPEEIAALTKDVDAKTAALQTQITNVCNLLDDKLGTLETNTTREAYDHDAGVADGHAGNINTWWREYQAIVKALQSGTKVDDLGTDYLKDLAAMRDNLPTEMDQIHVNLMPSTGGAEGAIVEYAHLLSDQAGYSPTKVAQYPGTHVFPASYVNSAYDMTDYYTSQLALGMYLYSEVTHLAFPNVNSDAHPYTVQPTLASDYATVLAGYANDFARQASAGTDNYLKTGIGRIPDGTVLDYRDKAHPRLWSDKPVTLLGDSSATAGYCPTVSTLCYLRTYDKDDNLGDLRVTRPSWAPLPAMIDATQWGGIDGWRVPTSDDWTAVQAGAGSAGLTATADAMGMTIFDRSSTTLHVNGVDSTVQAVRPTLVDIGTTNAPHYGLMTSVDAKDTALTSRSILSTSTNGEGGSLFLVQDFVPSTASPQPAPMAVRKARPVRPVKGRHGGLGLDGPKTFDDATSCQAYTVPAGASAVTVTATGGSGADGVQNGNGSASGGRGGVVTATIPAAAGTTLYVRVGVNGSGTAGTAGGGGSAGAADPVLFGSKPSSGGAGGGMSGLSSYDNCASFLLAAGGGGGGGAGLTIPESMTGGKGGDSCLISGSTAAVDGTCSPATDGAAHLKVSKGSQPYGDSGGKAGGGPGKANGGAAGTAKPYDETTYNQPGTSATGIAGGNGGGNGSQSAHSFGGGGGGGAGYLGGGGGGGGGNIGAGGGGGGGTSFVVNGLPTNGSFSLAAKGTTPSVTITPVAAPVVLQSSTTGEVANIAGGSNDDGTPLIQYPRMGAWNEQWRITPLDDSASGEFSIVNPTDSKCLAASDASQNGQIRLQTCTGKTGQRWRLSAGGDGTAAVVSAIDAPGSGRLVLSTDRGYPTVGGASLTLALDTSAPGQRWSTIAAGW